MKLLASLIAVTVLLAACNPTPTATGPEPAETASTMDIPGAERDATTPVVATVAKDSASGAVAEASGTVESVDVAAGKITIAHGPVSALKWPAMTMAFAASPEQLASVQPGAQVDFEFVSEGMDASLTSIRKR